jgi:hypothetical protein
MTRTKADGSAYKGSQRQLQDYVNDTPSELNQQIFGAIESLPRSAGLRWVSPLREERLCERGYQEYSDAEFLAAVRQTALSFELRRFWPSGGPTWDALAIVYTGGPSGVLLVEAKAHPAEMQSACGAKDKASIRKITAALDATKSWLKVPVSVDWFSQYYQAANRLAHLYFLREIARVPAWLANVYFVDDASHKATTRLEWDKGIDEAEKCLGLSGVSVPYAGKVFLSAKKVAAPDGLCI